MFDPRPLTATVDRHRLVCVLDFVADAGAELERLGDDPDLVMALRSVIADVGPRSRLDGHGSP